MLRVAVDRRSGGNEHYLPYRQAGCQQPVQDLLVTPDVYLHDLSNFLDRSLVQVGYAAQHTGVENNQVQLAAALEQVLQRKRQCVVIAEVTADVVQPTLQVGATTATDTVHLPATTQIGIRQAVTESAAVTGYE